MNDLEKYREIINKIDEEIIDLISQRQKAVEGVIAVKKQTGQSALQPARWEQVIERVRTKATEENIDPEVIEDIWNLLHEYFLMIERRELKQL